MVPASKLASKMIPDRELKCDVIFMVILILVFYVDFYKKLIASCGMNEVP